MPNFKVSAYNREAKVADSFIITAISAREAEKQARDILFKRDGDWKIMLIDNDPDS